MQNLEIQFNVNIIKKIKSYNFQVDQIGSALFILFCLYESRFDLLDEFDDYNRQKRAFYLYKEMEIRGLVEYTPDPGEKEPLFTLTKEGVELAEYLKGEFKNNNQNVTSETIAVTGVEPLKEVISDGNSVEAWIDEWLDIFPRGVKTFGKLVRGDKQSCIRKMRVFMNENPFTKEIIMQATRNYVEYKRNENWHAMRCAVYFIYRVDQNGKVSDLASECENVVFNNENKNNEQENNLEIMA